MNNFCFSVLALGSKYRIMTQQLIENIEQYAPEAYVVVGTDNPSEFKKYQKVIAFKLVQKGILHCHHDQRFVIEKALTQFSLVIRIDADTKITDLISQPLQIPTGLHATHVENIVQHNQKYAPERLKYFEKLADKLKLDLNQVSFIGESLFAISTKDKNQAVNFIQQWGLISSYAELHGIHGGEGNIIGLAAQKAGLEIHKSPDWLKQINQVRQHLDASKFASKKSKFSHLQSQLKYHYRLNKARIIAMKNFDFYYN